MVQEMYYTNTIIPNTIMVIRIWMYKKTWSPVLLWIDFWYPVYIFPNSGDCRHIRLYSCVPLKSSDSSQFSLINFKCYPFKNEIQQQNLFLYVGGNKIGGWIDWVQGVEYPNCPNCEGNPLMDLVLLQLEKENAGSSDVSECNWGDGGVAHVTLCPQCHKPGLGWACTWIVALPCSVLTFVSSFIFC